MTERIPGRPSRSTLNGWRPNRLDKARLVQAASSGPCQAIVGDVVIVSKLLTSPGTFHKNEPGCLWIRHWDGSSSNPGEPLIGTAGIWELVQDEMLTIDGTPLDRVTPEYRVFLLAEAVRGLTDGEREAVLERVKMSAPL